MFNKESCRKCGSELESNKQCNDCNEIAIWICKNCNNIEEHIHVHRKYNNKISKVIALEI